MALDPTIISGGLKLLSGLFGKKPKTISIADQMEQQAVGARQAAAASGFNPLTILSSVQPNAAAAMSPGSPPPLASLAVLGDMIEDKYGQDGKDRREYNRLQNELLTLEVDRARSVTKVAPVASVAGGAALTGGRVQTKTGSFGASSGFGSPAYRDESALTPGRGDVVDPQRHASGVIQYDNALTGPVTLLGDDGEPFMEYLQVPFFGGPQVANNWARQIAGGYVAPFISKMIGVPLNERWRKSAKSEGWVNYKKPGSDNGKQPPRITIKKAN